MTSLDLLLIVSLVFVACHKVSPLDCYKGDKADKKNKETCKGMLLKLTKTVPTLPDMAEAVLAPYFGDC